MFSPSEGLWMLFWVLWRETWKSFRCCHTPSSSLTVSSTTGGQSPLTHSQAFFQLPLYLEAWSSPAYLSQVQEGTKSIKRDSVQLIKNQFLRGEEKPHPEPKAYVGPRLVPRKDRSAQSQRRVQRDLGWAIPGASCANREASLHLRQTDLGGQTHRHTCRSHARICFLTPATSPTRLHLEILHHQTPSARAFDPRRADVFFERYVVGEQSCGSRTFPQTWLYLFGLFCLVFDKIKSNYYLDIIFFER